MVKAEIGKKIKDCKIDCTDIKKKKLSDFLKKNLVIYFYPRDMTPGCTTESIDFNSNLSKIKKLNYDLVGVSRDSLKSHDKFIDKHKFKFPLISDETEKVCNLFDVIKEKSLYGRKYMGVDRSTFLLNKKGIILFQWRNVKVKGHVAEVINKIKEIG
ncbi:MAG: peroxiredoxin [Pseudomonadota bacterium]|nr:peroxiredoxin [Pseudomonadota bacterium]MED5274555.1 peroxiredoxin [Pseudomonadota bacterium]|tara:strand:+ start:266 stop:736 length:471 start_codon:yes stop_codon:yes gene_type:complete